MQCTSSASRKAPSSMHLGRFSAPLDDGFTRESTSSQPTRSSWNTRRMPLIPSDGRGSSTDGFPPAVGESPTPGDAPTTLTETFHVPLTTPFKLSARASASRRAGASNSKPAALPASAGSADAVTKPSNNRRPLFNTIPLTKPTLLDFSADTVYSQLKQHTTSIPSLGSLFPKSATRRGANDGQSEIKKPYGGGFPGVYLNDPANYDDSDTKKLYGGGFAGVNLNNPTSYDISKSQKPFGGGFPGVYRNDPTNYDDSDTKKPYGGGFAGVYLNDPANYEDSETKKSFGSGFPGVYPNDPTNYDSKTQKPCVRAVPQPKKPSRAFEQRSAGVGSAIMRKMGFKGGCLGKDGQGMAEPLALTVQAQEYRRQGLGKKTVPLDWMRCGYDEEGDEQPEPFCWERDQREQLRYALFASEEESVDEGEESEESEE